MSTRLPSDLHSCSCSWAWRTRGTDYVVLSGASGKCSAVLAVNRKGIQITSHTAPNIHLMFWDSTNILMFMNVYFTSNNFLNLCPNITILLYKWLFKFNISDMFAACVAFSLTWYKCYTSIILLFKHSGNPLSKEKEMLSKLKHQQSLTWIGFDPGVSRSLFSSLALIS